MLQYVNQFSCAINDRHTECVMNFLQERPALDAAGKIVGVETQVVSSIVMTTQCAQNMLGVVQQLVAASEGNSPASEHNTEE